jgi:tetratricopeptide (TPR) repeat protein
MDNPITSHFCNEQRLVEIMAVLEQDETKGLVQLTQALVLWPNDHRLCFLRGSCLAGQRRYNEALVDMQRAVEQAPDFAIARFQWGFLLLTCGDTVGAQQVWSPLDQLAPDDPLRLFKQGLCYLVQDQFFQTIESLRQGISANQANPHLNKDMQLVIDKVLLLVATGKREGQGTADEYGDTDLLLSGHAGNRGSIH